MIKILFTVAAMIPVALQASKEEPKVKHARFFYVQESSETQLLHLKQLKDQHKHKTYLTDEVLKDLNATEHVTLKAKHLYNADMIRLASLPSLHCLKLVANPDVTDLRPLLHQKTLRSLELENMPGIDFSALRDFLLDGPKLNVLVLKNMKVTQAELAILKAVFDASVRIKHDGMLALSTGSLNELREIKKKKDLIHFMDELRDKYKAVEVRPWISDVLWGKGRSK